MSKVLLSLGIILLPGLLTGDEVQDNPHQILVSELSQFFKEIKADVLSVSGEELTIGAGSEQGIKTQMRFDIVVTMKIRHPVTEEEIGSGNIKTGRLEIIKVDGQASEGRLIEGTAKPGSHIVLSRLPFKVFVEEEKEIDYFIINDYLKELKKLNRFELVNDKTNSDIIIMLSQKEVISQEGIKILKLLQRAFWTRGLTEGPFLESEVEVSTAYLEKIKKDKALYEEELKGSDLLLSFRVPGNVRFLNIADIDGDGKRELIIARDNYVEVYGMGTTLKGLYELKIKGEPLALYSADINKDNRSEIILTVLEDNRVTSGIYELKEGELKPLYTIKGVLRYTDGKLLTQDYSIDGPAGKIREIDISASLPKLQKNTDFLGHPASSITDIFGFVIFGKDNLTLLQDNRGYLNLYDKDGKLLWRSKWDTGGFYSTFKKPARSPLLPEEEWGLKERMIVEGERVYLIRRKPVSGMTKGIGWSSSEIVSLRWDGKEMTEEIIKDVGGAIVDFYLTENRLYILQKPFMGISLKSLFKGENPKQTRLYIFKRP